MEPVSAEIVEKTWKRIESLSPRAIPNLIQRMTREQPVVLAYLMAVDKDILNQDERELLLYLGVDQRRWLLTIDPDLPRHTSDL